MPHHHRLTHPDDLTVTNGTFDKHSNAVFG